MKTAAPKEGKLFSLAAVVFVMALLAAPAADAARYLPNDFATTQALSPPNLAAVDQLDAEAFWLFAESDVERFGLLAVFDASEREQVTTENRIRLFEESGSIPRPLEWFAISKLASGLSTCASESNIWETGDLVQNCGSPSFQGLWTDPTTGIAYARNRWYDARNASWLSEDPKGAVDSVNLYAFVGWGPHIGRDPMGLCEWGDWDCFKAEAVDVAVAGAEMVGGVPEGMYDAFEAAGSWGTAVGEALKDPMPTLMAIDQAPVNALRFGLTVANADFDVALADGWDALGKSYHDITMAKPKQVGNAIGGILIDATVALMTGGGSRVAGASEEAFGLVKSLPRFVDASDDFIGPLIGRVSQARTSEEFSLGFFSRYQRYADEAYETVQSRLAAGTLNLSDDLPEATQIGGRIDAAARARLRLSLGKEFGGEGVGQYGQVNRWLRDPNPESMRYRIPDAALPGNIFDLTIGTKGWDTPQIKEFDLFSGGSHITVVRPQAVGGSYSLWR